MRASPSLSQLWQPHSRLCQLCRVCEQQRSCSPGFCRKELHATESAVEVRRARRNPGTRERGHRHRRASLRRVRWTFHSGQRRLHAHEPRSCSRLSGEARDHLWRSGSCPSISVNPASTPFNTEELFRELLGKETVQTAAAALRPHTAPLPPCTQAVLRRRHTSWPALNLQSLTVRFISSMGAGGGCLRTV